MDSKIIAFKPSEGHWSPMRATAFLAVILCIATAASPLDLRAQEVVTPEMEQLRTAYENAREKATRPIDERYLAELIKLQDTYTRAAKLEQAVAAANEVKRMKERLGIADSTSAPVLSVTAPPSQASGEDVVISIPANDANGYRLGAVKRGDSIVLQYSGGLWKSMGGIATENPDNPKATYGDNDRLVIAEAMDAKKQPGDIIKLVPPDTVTKPFTYLFQTSRDDVVLRIHSNSSRSENPGAVSYKVRIIRK